MIELPWPSSALSPNARVHYHKRNRVFQEHKGWARLATMAARPTAPETGVIRVIVTAHPAGRWRMDRDNFLTRIKSYLDGVAVALGVDDSRFNPSIEWGEPVRFGKVLIAIDNQDSPGRFGPRSGASEARPSTQT